MPPGTTRVTLRKLLVWPGNVEEFFECDWRWPDLHEETEVRGDGVARRVHRLTPRPTSEEITGLETQREEDKSQGQRRITTPEGVYGEEETNWNGWARIVVETAMYPSSSSSSSDGSFSPRFVLRLPSFLAFDSLSTPNTHSREYAA
ncbi:hypothetical protein K0M31_019376 [Melipona bicolor]|uniref:Uncharacterized protein n=1 Tax=Melipona bicolor TaxID=60889 RepID=A0AA40G2A2_9HYME|nr:hypothetical protein K0M31_019376 [Melipona bicolor]